jgi:hypothetical protein
MRKKYCEVIKCTSGIGALNHAAMGFVAASLSWRRFRSAKVVIIMIKWSTNHENLIELNITGLRMTSRRPFRTAASGNRIQAQALILISWEMAFNTHKETSFIIPSMADLVAGNITSPVQYDKLSIRSTALDSPDDIASNPTDGRTWWLNFDHWSQLPLLYLVLPRASAHNPLWATWSTRGQLSGACVWIYAGTYRRGKSAQLERPQT